LAQGLLQGLSQVLWLKMVGIAEQQRELHFPAKPLMIKHFEQ
jgi:hypothetical protein